MLVKDTIAISITLWTHFSIETSYQNPILLQLDHETGCDKWQPSSNKKCFKSVKK